MKGRIKRLSKDPVLLVENANIIKTQEEKGIIERVSIMHAIVHKDAAIELFMTLVRSRTSLLLP